MRRFRIALLLPLAVTAHALPARAAWPVDTHSNVVVDTSAYAELPVISADGVGGTLVAWVGSWQGGSRVLVQRFNASGQALWSPNGVPIVPARGGQTQPQIAADGLGGAFVTWNGNAFGYADDIFVQHLNAAGNLLWADVGVGLGALPANHDDPVMVSDGAGGMIVVWAGGGVRGQRVNASGTVLWPAHGALLCSSGGALPQVASDGAGGAVATWFIPSSGQAHANVFAQRVDSAGVAHWGPGGVAVCSTSGDQSYPGLVADSAGGAIVAWTDSRSGPYWNQSEDVYAQRLDASGTLQWGATGVAVCTAVSWQGLCQLVSDGAGGAILSWVDHRTDSTQAYVQRLSSSGAALWTSNGVGLFSSDRGQIDPVLAMDGAGGAFAAWLDHRDGEFRVYGQRLSSGGSQLWGAGGLALSSASANQWNPAIAWDGTGGAVVAWSDDRKGTMGVFAQGVSMNGLGGNAAVTPAAPRPSSLALAPALANPSHGSGMLLRFTLTSSAPAAVEVLDLSGRSIARKSVGELGPGAHTMDALGDRTVPPGIYLVRLEQDGQVRVARIAKLD